MARGVKGWGNIYYGNERMWNNGAWAVIGPIMAILMIVAAIWLLPSYRPGSPDTVAFPAQLATDLGGSYLSKRDCAMHYRPPYEWSEVAFDMYYLLLFFTTMPIVYHFHYVKTHGRSGDKEPPHPEIRASCACHAAVGPPYCGRFRGTPVNIAEPSSYNNLP